MFRGWSVAARLRFYFIFGGWMFLIGIILVPFEGPPTLLASAAGLGILIRGFITLADEKRKRL